MDITEIASTNFVLLQDSWTMANCLELIKHLHLSHVIIYRENTEGTYHLFEASYVSQLLANASSGTSLAEVLATTACPAIPTVESDAEAEDAPDQCIILEEGSPVGFFDASIPPDLGTLRSGQGADSGVPPSEVVLPSLIVDVPDKVSLEKTVSVLVLFSPEPISERSTTLSLELPPPGAVVDIVIKAMKGIVVEGNGEGQLKVPAQGESSALQFKLHGVELGIGTVRIYACYNGQERGSLLQRIPVVDVSNDSPGSRQKQEYELQPLRGQQPTFSPLIFERRLRGQTDLPFQSGTQDRSLRDNSEQNEQAQGKKNTIEKCPEIHWEKCSPEQLVLHLKIGQEHVEANMLLQKQAINELCALLCKLFSGARDILVEALTPGFSGSKVLKIRPFYADLGGCREVVVKFGDVQAIAQEYDNYIKYVRDFIGDGRITDALNYHETAHLGGILYSLLGANGQEIHHFGDFYQQKEFPKIKQVLDRLFRRTCGLWYANSTALLALNLTEDYRWQGSNAPEKLEREAAEHLPSVQFQEFLTFKSFKAMAGRNFTNPFRFLASASAFTRPTYECTVHGDLSRYNIFIDQTGFSWLIDFYSTGRSHILRDVATLDVVVRFQLLDSHEATLDDFLSMERVLYSISNFSKLKSLSASYTTISPALEKAYQTVLHLRKLAHWLVEKNPADDMSEYYIALFYLSLETLQFFSLQTEQRERALLSASLLVDILGLNRK